MNDDFKKKLHSYKFKATPARVALLDAFSKNRDPMNAEQAWKNVKKTGIDLVTVYRTITSFEESGLLRRIDVKKDAIYFELNDDHHHHIICTNCDKISDFNNEKDEKLVATALKNTKDFSKIFYHSFDLFGLCNSCARK